MKKSHLFLATFTSIAIVGGICSRTLLQPLPPPPPQLQESPSPLDKQNEKPSLPKLQESPSPPDKQNEKPSLPSEQPSLPSGEISLPNQEVLLDAAANVVIEKFQNASCEELSTMTANSDKNSPAGGEQQAAIQKKAIALLEKNPEIREEFLNRVAAPIANKMFDCNLIP
ncbi:MAG: hypothetical protein F6K41_11945 [Symploca sp. SIO3E6]|nr:hypothetical protein [Caldora sp. SIO3E6]